MAKSKKPDIDLPQPKACGCCGAPLEMVDAVWITDEPDGVLKFESGKKPKHEKWPTSVAAALEIAAKSLDDQEASLKSELKELKTLRSKLKTLTEKK